MAQVTNREPPKVVDNTAGVPFPKPRTKEQKHANSVARAKRREASRKARTEAEEAALAVAAAKAKTDGVKPVETTVEHALIDEDKPIVSYDEAETEETVPATYSSDETPGVFAEAVNDTEPVGDPAFEETPMVEEPPVTEPVVEDRPGVELKLTRKQRRRAEHTARIAARKADAETVVETPVVEEGEQHVDEALVEAGSFAETKRREAETTQVAEQATDVPVDEPVVEVPADEAVADHEDDKLLPSDTNDGPVSTESVDAPNAEPVTDEPVIEEAVPDEPVVEEPTTTEPVVEETASEEPVVNPVANPVNDPVTDVAPVKPTLTLVANNPNDPKAAAARKFYGDAFTPERAELLTKAHFWLERAILAEIEGNEGKVKLAFKAALKNEAEAFGSTMAMAA